MREARDRDEARTAGPRRRAEPGPGGREPVRTRARLLAAVGLAVAALCVPPLCKWAPALVWNASASSPVGLYRVTTPRGVGPEDMVVAWLPPPARELAAARGYLPGNVPLVKRVAAAGGDRVCARGSAILVNGRLVARRRASDPGGRAMPWWRGCGRLAPGELFLLSPGIADAYDGRYFGITRPFEVVGRARLLWPR